MMKKTVRVALVTIFIFGILGCEEGGKACGNTDFCEIASDMRCYGEVVQLCKADENGCLVWQDDTDCRDAGLSCAGDGGLASCLCDTPDSGLPQHPVPDANSGGIDITLTKVTWDTVNGALSYDVAFGTTCPPPEYPDIAFQNVTVSELTGLSLEAETGYCWQVAALANNGCPTLGPVWSFATHCADDPEPGPPLVVSPLTASYPPDTTDDFYLLQFSEPINHAGQAIRLTPIIGSGTYAGTKRVAESETDFQARFSGMSSGDRFTITVGTAVVDDCGRHLPEPVDIAIQIQ